MTAVSTSMATSGQLLHLEMLGAPGEKPASAWTQPPPLSCSAPKVTELEGEPLPSYPQSLTPDPGAQRLFPSQLRQDPKALLPLAGKAEQSWGKGRKLLAWSPLGTEAFPRFDWHLFLVKLNGQ